MDPEPTFKQVNSQITGEPMKTLPDWASFGPKIHRKNRQKFLHWFQNFSIPLGFCGFSTRGQAEYMQANGQKRKQSVFHKRPLEGVTCHQFAVIYTVQVFWRVFECVLVRY
jgi:hypothetical protein